MNEKLLDALDELSDRYVLQAVRQKRRRRRLMIKAAAAVLAAVILMGLLWPGASVAFASELVSPAVYTPLPFPASEDYEDMEERMADYEEWVKQEERREADAAPVVSGLQGFTKDAAPLLLDGEENGIWSPLNAYISLAMLAQTASGTTRQEIVDALGAGAMEELRAGVRAVWEQVELDGDSANRTIANSLWLDDGLRYHRKNLKILGTDFYASVHRTDLDSSEADAQIQEWISGQTDGLLEGTAPEEDADPSGRRVLVLASTLYVSGSWMEPFKESSSREGVFHGPDGDVTCTYMNGQMEMAEYCRGGDFSAVGLGIEMGCDLWLVLPDEGTTVSELLENGEYLDTVLSGEYEKGVKVRLSMPKFDMSASMDLSDGLKQLGIREAFSSLGGDFSETLSMKGPIYVDGVQQSARIIVDEQGVRAASAAEITVVSKGIDPQIVELTLDRPFLFVLTYRDVPLFAGVVAEP